MVRSPRGKGGSFPSGLLTAPLAGLVYAARGFGPGRPSEASILLVQTTPDGLPCNAGGQVGCKSGWQINPHGVKCMRIHCYRWRSSEPTFPQA